MFGKRRKDKNRIFTALAKEVAEDFWFEGYRICKETERLFPLYRFYTVHGGAMTFPFKTLPSGSYAYIAINDDELIQLDPHGHGFAQVLGKSYEQLKAMPVSVLADYILRFCSGHATDKHRVLIDITDLEERRGKVHTRLIEENYERVKDRAGITTMDWQEDVCEIRALTMYGPVWSRSDLGVERIKIARNGAVSLSEREVLCGEILTDFPEVRV